jgi:hypothetical protein
MSGPAQAWRAGPCVRGQRSGLPACHPGILADIPPGAAVDDDPILIPACGEAKRRSPKIQLFLALIPKALTWFAISQPFAPMLPSYQGSGPAQAGRTEFFMLASMRCCTLVSNSRSL